MNGRERIGDHNERGGGDKLVIIYMNKIKKSKRIKLVIAVYLN